MDQTYTGVSVLRLDLETQRALRSLFYVKDVVQCYGDRFTTATTNRIVYYLNSATQVMLSSMCTVHGLVQCFVGGREK